MTVGGVLAAARSSVSQQLHAPMIMMKPIRAGYSHSEIESKMARKDFSGLTKQDLATPALVLDQEVFENNILKMASHCKASGINFRPHIKVHKCPEIAKRQMASGAVGVCCATIAECELMISSGIHGVLWTCQPIGRNKINRAIDLARRDSTFMCVVDDPVVVEWLNQAAEDAKVNLKLVVDIDIGLQRQGVQPGEPALRLAQQVAGSKKLSLAGLMGYTGAASHTKGWENRRKRSSEDLEKLFDSVQLCRKNGIPVGIVTGGSTGTYNIDSEIEGITEMQVGSYVVMDTVYRTIGSKNGGEQFDDFGTALTVLSTVVSKTKPGRATVDAGNKSMARETDEVKALPGVKFASAGAEYGTLTWEDAEKDLKLGDRVELIVSNIDTSVNVFDRIFVCRGEQVTDVYSIMGRTGPAQR
jgi:D-serine deaminase-like pyridoxal phosphate-dependent protein